MATAQAEPPTAAKGKALNVVLEADLRDAIERCRKKNRRSLKDEVSIALEEYAAKHGEYELPG